MMLPGMVGGGGGCASCGNDGSNSVVSRVALNNLNKINGVKQSVAAPEPTPQLAPEPEKQESKPMFKYQQGKK